MPRKANEDSGPGDLDDGYDPRDRPQPRLTDEELIFFRKEKRRAENMSWAWQQLRPWLIPAATVVSAVVGWLFTHNITIKGP